MVIIFQRIPRICRKTKRHQELLIKAGYQVTYWISWSFQEYVLPERPKNLTVLTVKASHDYIWKYDPMGSSTDWL